MTMSYVTARLRERNRRLSEAVKDLREEVADALSHRERRFVLLKDIATALPGDMVEADVVVKTVAMQKGERLAYGVMFDPRNYDNRQLFETMVRAFNELLLEACKRRQLPCEVKARERDRGATIELTSVRLVP